RPQVVAVGKPTWNQHRVHALQIFGIVPEKGYRLMSELSNYMERIVITVRAGRDEYAKLHVARLSASTFAQLPVDPGRQGSGVSLRGRLHLPHGPASKQHTGSLSRGSRFAQFAEGCADHALLGLRGM